MVEFSEFKVKDKTVFTIFDNSELAGNYGKRVFWKYVFFIFYFIVERYIN